MQKNSSDNEKRNVEEKKYLFSWADVPGNDSYRLIDHLVKDLKIDWAKNAIIKKNDKCIIVTKDENSLELELNEKENEVILKTSSGKTYGYNVKKEKGNLNIYERKITDREFLYQAFPIVTIMGLIVVIMYYIISSIFIKEYWPPLLPYIVMPILISIFLFIILPLKEFGDKISEKIQHKYGISEFTLVALIMIFYVVIAALIIPMFTDEAPLSIAQIVFVIFFGILLLFILKKIETV